MLDRRRRLISDVEEVEEMGNRIQDRVCIRETRAFSLKTPMNTEINDL